MKQSLILGALSVVRLVLGVLAQGYVLAQLGVGMQTDAWLVGATMPALATLFVAAPLNQVLAPLFAAEMDDVRRRDAWTCFALLLLACAVAVAVLFATAHVWVGWLVPGFSPDAKILTAELVSIQLISVVFLVPFSVLWSLQCANGKLVVAEGVSLASTFIYLALTIWLLPRFGVRAAAFAAVLKALLDILLLGYSLGRWRGLALHSPLLREAWRRARYLFAGAAYFGTESLVNQWLASFAAQGNLSAFLISQQCYNVMAQVSHKAIAAPMMPVVAVEAQARRWNEVRRTYGQRLIWASGLAVAAYLGIVLLGRPLLGLFVGRSGITSDNVDLLWRTLVLLGGMCFGAWLGQVTVSALHAMGDTKSPTQFGFVTYTIYIPLKLVAFAAFGIAGLAVATSAFFIVNLAGQYVLLSRAVTQRHKSYSPHEGRLAIAEDAT